MAKALLARRLARRIAAAALLWLGLIGAAGAAPAGATSPPAAAALVPARGAMFGAWTAPGDASAEAAFESTIGRRLDIVHQYHAFDESWPTSAEYSWAAGGRIIFGNISARTSGGSVLTWTAIASGAEDSTINAMASRLRAFGRLVFVSFDEEPEGRYDSNPGVYTWASFSAAWRHVHDRFYADGVRNVVWVWNVVGDPGNESWYTGGLYPGDGYVDWIAWDPYNWNTCIHPFGWRTFDQIVAPFYNWLAGGNLSAGSAAKPYMLAEYGSVEGGAGAKGQWFLGEASTISARPRLKAVVYFNENKDCNWPITTSASSVAGFRSAGLSCWFNRAVPSTPGSVSATPGNGFASVSWAPVSSVCPIAAYTVFASPGNREVSAGTATSVKFTGLADGTAYRFQVKATSMNGNSAWSAQSATVTPSGAASATTSPSPSPTGRATPTSAATSTTAPSATTPAGQKPAAARSSATGLSGWLESHIYVLPIAVIVLLGLGLATQRFTSSGRPGG